MAATRTSSRQAARKANEAISSTNGSRGKASGTHKRKGSTAKLPAPKKEKKEDTEPKEQNGEDHIAAEHQEKEQRGKTDEIQKAHEAEQPQPEHKLKHEPSEEDQKEEKEEKAKAANGHEDKATTPQEKPPDKEPEAGVSVESGIKKSEEREDIVPSNVLEKGIIYFFFRPRVNVEEPHSIQDVSRSFIVLRPTPKGAMLGAGQGSVATDAHCRLMMLPKKKFPTSARERDMGFVEKAGISMKDLQDSFITGAHYETSTRGERTRPEAKPYAEGVYAITTARRSSHLVYILTIPSEAGNLQHDFGVYQRGSWIIQSKNPKYPGPSYARLPKDPEYPDDVREKFHDLRWVPTEPEFINYPNAQFLMIGSAKDDLGKAAIAEAGAKEPSEEQPGEELEKLEHGNKERIEALQGDDTIYEDLELDAKNYPKVPTTWNFQE